MSHPPEVTLPRTPVQEHEDRISRAAASIRRDWPHMLPTSAPGRRIGGGSRSATITSADQTMELKPAQDIDPMTRLVSLRRYVTDCLNGWCRVVMEDRDITAKALPLGDDVPGMCAFLERHANWLGPQDYARDLADELGSLQRAVHAVVDPPKRDRHRLGRCPFVLTDDDGAAWSCDGRVQVAIDEDAETATCTHCRQSGPVAWWEDVLGIVVGGVNLDESVRPQRMVDILRDRLHVTITERTLRNWCRAGKVTPLVPFGPQPKEPRYWLTPRTVLDEVAHMDRQCPMCGRLFSRGGDVCLRCRDALWNARSRYADERPAYIVGSAAPKVAALESCAIDERTVCAFSDLPARWCGCGRHAR